MTSRYEGFPLVLLEAKSALLPIVSFECKTGPKELINDNVNGFLIECFNTQNMADKIIKLIENTTKRKEFSNHSLDDIQEFEYGFVINKWVELLNELGEVI